MENKKVTVLTPNGRRQMLSITPSTTMLKVLEDVCAKHGFNSEEYDLKHHKKVMDPTAMFRFTGLPNNCLLEMVESTRKRDVKDVVLCVQLEDGSRRQGTFKISENLLNILKELCNDMIGSEKNPVFIYMRKEIFGEELEKTSLKSLGITDRAMIRLIDRKPEELRKQANVYIPPVVKEQPSKEDEKLKQHKVVEAEKPNSSNLENETTQQKPMSKPASHSFQLTPDALKKLKGATDVVPSTSMNEQKEGAMEVDSPSTSTRTEYDWGTGGRSMNEIAGPTEDVSDLSEEEDVFEEPQLIQLGERNAVIFSLAQAQKIVHDLPDSFFDLTTEDLRLILNDLRKQASGNEDEPLLTTKLREMEEQNKILKKMATYKTCVIRVQFSDRLVLQGTFKPMENVEQVYKFVKGYLKDPEMPFYLFTTPPKKIPEIDKTLIESDFVPTVVLHFGIDNVSANGEHVLKSDLLDKLSSPNGAAIAASKSRGKLAKAGGSKHLKNNSSQSPKGAIPKKPKPDDFKESSAAAGPSGQVPKWFRPFKK